MTSARTSVTPTGTDHVHEPTEVNLRTVSDPTVEDVGVHAAACATLETEKVETPTDATVNAAALTRRRKVKRVFINEV
jgi:hypothetical protein